MSAGLNLKELGEIARHRFGTNPRVPIELRQLAAMAGHALFSAHSWKFLEDRSIDLAPRAEITLLGATWTEATRQLEETGAFADYDHIPADTIDITGGTGATTNRFEVQEKLDDDTIILRTSIGAAANGQTDITATLANDQILLPSEFDFQQIVGYSMTNGLIGVLEPASAQVMLDVRSWGTLGSTVGFWSLLRHVRSRTTTDGRAIPTMELWPKSSTNDQELRIFYRAGWSDPQTDDELLCLPLSGWLNLLFIEFFLAVVGGLEEPEEGSVADRLAAIRGSSTFTDAMIRDATMQPELGPTENGWLEQPMRIGRFDVPTPTPIVV